MVWSIEPLALLRVGNGTTAMALALGTRRRTAAGPVRIVLRIAGFERREVLAIGPSSPLARGWRCQCALARRSSMRSRNAKTAFSR